MSFFVAGLNHKTTPVELREKLACGAAKIACRACRLKTAGNLSEVVILSTCNRVEIYGASEGPVSAERLFNTLASTGVDLAPYLYFKQDSAAIEHLLTVASGLDSLVLGETEITGQVKQAYQAAQAAKLTGKVTNRVFQAALQTAKEVRTRTSIGRGATSVGSVAVELAQQIFDGTLEGKTVLIVGAGKMGEACVRHFAKKGAPDIVVANRSLWRAAELATEFGGRAVPFDSLMNAVQGADIVVTSTGAPHTILHRTDIEAVMHARRQQPLFLIDIAVPRDIDPDVQQIEGVYLYNVDHLEEIVQQNVRLRQQELERCHEIIGAQCVALTAKLAGAPAVRPSSPTFPAPRAAVPAYAR